jgi:hypothetical protein
VTGEAKLAAAIVVGFVLLGALGLSWRHPVAGDDEVVVLPSPDCPSHPDGGASTAFDLGKTRAAGLNDIDFDSFRSPVRVFEDGRPLAPHTPLATIREQGRGTFSHWGSFLYLAATDNTDPASNGRRYRVVVDPEVAQRNGAFLAPRWLWGIVVLWQLGIAVALARRARKPAAARRHRVAALLALAALFAAHLANRWDYVEVVLDSPSYVVPWSGAQLRPPAYPLFVALTAADPAARAAEAAVPDPHGERPHGALAGAVRAQRALLLATLLVLAAVLMREISPPLVLLGAIELVRGGWLVPEADAIWSEALAQSFMFLVTAALVVHARATREPPALALAALAAGLLLLTRPAGAYVLVPLAAAVAFAYRRSGRAAGAAALAAAATLAALLALPFLYRTIVEGNSAGASMGPVSRIGFALQVADAGDVERMPDETARDFLRRALERRGAAGPAEGHFESECFSRNVYGIALPLAHEMGCDNRALCSLFDRVCFAVLPRHLGHVASIAWGSLRQGWGYSRVNPFTTVRGGVPFGLLVLAALGALWWRAPARVRFLSATLWLGHAAALVVIALGDAPDTRYVFATEPLALVGTFVLLASSAERFAEPR